MPPISHEQLAAKITSKNLRVVLLSGQDSFLRERCREQIIEATVDPASRQWAVEHYSAAQEDFAAVLGRARMMPMLATRQVIILSDLEEIDSEPESEGSESGKTAKDSRKADAAALLEEYISEPAPFTVLVLEAVKLDKRTRLSKLLSQKAIEISAELPEDPKDPNVRLEAAVRTTKQMVSQQGGSIEDEAAEELADLCNCDLALIRTEITKLLTYGGAEKKISTAEVEALVVSERKYDVWELADVMVAGDRARALKFLDKLIRDGEQTPAMVGALAWMFRKLLEVQDLPRGISPWEATGRLQMRANQAQMALRQAPKIPRAQLIKGLQALYEADSRLKSGARDDRAVMEFLLTEIMGAKKEVAGKS
jgi:DNA polymerase-3 subunit delta